MEHLLAPNNSRPIDIPYICSEEFEAAGALYDDPLANLKSYWQRKSWSHPTTHDLLLDNQSQQMIASSLQTCLYFGCLISIFRRLGMNVCTRDFLETSESHVACSFGCLAPVTRRLGMTTCAGQKVFVRTKRLAGLIAEWIHLEGIAKGPVVQDFYNPKYMRGENIKEMLEWTWWYLQPFSNKIDRMDDETDQPYKSQMRLVELSIMAMGESLCSVTAAVYGYRPTDLPVWGPSDVLKKRLLANGWCLSDSPFFPEAMNRAAIAADYYFGSFLCPLSRGNHAECRVSICNQYCQNVKLGAERKHTPQCSEPSCGLVQVPKKAIELINQDKIPVLEWDGNDIQISAVDSQPRQYVAISHVWSDGLGNENENSLLRCELARLQSLVNNLYSEPHQRCSEDGRHTPEIDSRVPFWIDTLCVPVGEQHGLGEDKTKALRKKAIGRMADIYRLADRVLVLDAFILTLPRSADLVDKYLRIHLSKWHHRLWTMQEGQLAHTLFFQFKDGPQSFYDMKGDEVERFDGHTPQNLCSPIRLLCAVELEAFYRYFEVSGGTAARHVAANDSDHSIAMRLRSCAKYLRSRQTSKHADESVCVANILGLEEVDTILKYDKADDRMTRFYDLVRNFDARIIFHEHPRLRRVGYGWAPSSFLSQLPDLIPIRDEYGVEDFRMAQIIPRGGGLPVQFGGFELSSERGPQPGSFVFIKPFTDGRPWMLQYQGIYNNKVPWWACTFRVDIPKFDLPSQEGTEGAESGRTDRGAPNESSQRWAIILPGSLHADCLPSPGVMGIVTENSPRNPDLSRETHTVWTSDGRPGVQLPKLALPRTISIRAVCSVHVSIPQPETVSPNAPWAGAWAYSTEQKWLVL